MSATIPQSRLYLLGMGFFSPAAIANLFAVPLEPLRLRLLRWRRANLNGAWHEVTDRTSREAGYLYQLRAVRHLIAEPVPLEDTPIISARKADGPTIVQPGD